MNPEVNENTDENDIDPAGTILDLEDEALANVSGGCTSTCGSARVTPCPPIQCYQLPSGKPAFGPVFLLCN